MAAGRADDWAAAPGSAWRDGPFPARFALGTLLVVVAALTGCGLAEVADLTLVNQGSPTKPNGTAPGDDPSDPGNLPAPGARVLRGNLGADAVQRLAVRTQADATQRDAAALQVVCSTQAVPPSTAASALDAQGSFKVQLANAANTSLGCSLVGGGNTLLANFTFQGGGQDIDGNARVAHDVVLTGDVDMGRVYYDETTFEVAVNNDNIAEQRADNVADGVVNPVGTWTLAAVDFALPTGSSNVCDAGASGDGCPSGLHAGDSLAWLQFAGNKLSDGSRVWAQQVWDQPAQAVSCGGKLGLSNAAQKQAGLDFAKATSGAFTYSSSLRWPNAAAGGLVTSSPVASGYALVTAAQAAVDYGSCTPLSVHVGNGNVQGALCGPDGNTNYRFVGSDGCTNAQSGLPSTTQPYFADFAAAQDAGHCTTTKASGNVVVQQCHLNGSGEALVCSSTTVDYANASAGVTLAPNSFDYPSFNTSGLAVAGAPCQGIGTSSAAARLAQRSCFVDFAQASGAVDSDNACLAETWMNAAATDTNAQLVQDYRPVHLRYADLLQPFGAASGTVATRRKAMSTAHAATPRLGPAPLSCLVVRTRSVTFTQVSATRLLATFTEQVGTDDTRPACLATFALGATRTVAYLDHP